MFTVNDLEVLDYRHEPQVTAFFLIETPEVVKNEFFCKNLKNSVKNLRKARSFIYNNNNNENIINNCY